MSRMLHADWRQTIDEYEASLPAPPRHCPFCGTHWHGAYLRVIEKDSDPLNQFPEHDRETLWAVTCYRCAYDGPWGHDRQEAIDRWNVRKRCEISVECSRHKRAQKGAKGRKRE